MWIDIERSESWSIQLVVVVDAENDCVGPLDVPVGGVDFEYDTREVQVLFDELDFVWWQLGEHWWIIIHVKQLNTDLCSRLVKAIANGQCNEVFVTCLIVQFTVIGNIDLTFLIFKEYILSM